MYVSPIPVLCLPFAGGAASFFWPWTRWEGDGIRIVPVQPAGREERIEEEAERDLRSAVRALAPRVRAALEGETRVALFGHSLGASLAYELALGIEREARIGVVHLFVSGAPEPSLMRDRRATGLSDGAFLARVEEFAGYRHPSLEIPEIREMALPTLRADVEMHENYRPASGDRLSAPITCLLGEEDTLVSVETAERWADRTEGFFTMTRLPGGHMYLADPGNEDTVLSIMDETLNKGEALLRSFPRNMADDPSKGGRP